LFFLFLFGVIDPYVLMANRLAWAEMKLILAKVIWSFDIELGGQGRNVGEWNDQKVYLINEKTPLWVRVRGRA